MAADRTRALERMLVAAETAHGTYEATDLGGVYDRDWPRWYAEYLVQHGVDGPLGRAVAAVHLEDFLARSSREYDESGAKDTESWAAYTARRMSAEL